MARKRHGQSHVSPSPTPKENSGTDTEGATRLQVFLDRANFSPGKIDGHYNDFTRKALSLYRQSLGQASQESSPTPDTTPDLSGIDLAKVSPVFSEYRITDSDMKNIGRVPNSVREKAKLSTLLYRNVAEEIAEKFHCDRKFLAELNPAEKAWRLGDQVRVPNVEPFELDAVKNLKPGSEITPELANEIPDATDAPESSPAPTPVASIKVDVKSNMLSVFEDNKLVAAYPVTVGSGQTTTPIGQWKVRGVAKLPAFRYDEQMLRHGKRSGSFQILRPGPNNPVGVIWIALNKQGIGIHGTDEPDTIGATVSHGCIRLANWDIVRLAAKVKTGMPVEIE